MSAKNLDSKGRFRSRTIGFRVSPEEEKLINSAANSKFITVRLCSQNFKILPIVCLSGKFFREK